MWQAPRYRGIDREARQRSRLGPAALRAGVLLAIPCLSFGAAFAAFVPASLEQRIGSLFLFGLMPAVGFYAGGQLLMFSSQLCEMIVARCFRCVVLLVNDLMSAGAPRVSNSLERLPALRQKAYYLVRRACWRVHAAVFDFSCLLIRSAARCIIRMQASRP
jgi:hypothetical protein